MAFNTSQELRRVRSRLIEAESALAGLDVRNEDVRAPGMLHGYDQGSQAAPKTGEQPPTEKITKADIDASLALNERHKTGEYILKFERPVDRKLMESAVSNLASTMASNKAAELDRVFSQLGLSPEVSKQLKVHQEKIGLASLKTEMDTQQLLIARQAYDSHVRSLLSSEDYTKYRQYEDSRLATGEYVAVQDFGIRNNTPFDPAYDQQIVVLIQSTQAYTEDNWHGPYDGLPRVAMGTEMVIARLQEDIDKTRQASTLLQQKAIEASLPEASVSLLTAYYEQKIQAKQYGLDRLMSQLLPSGTGR